MRTLSLSLLEQGDTHIHRRHEKRHLYDGIEVVWIFHGLEEIRQSLLRLAPATKILCLLKATCRTRAVALISRRRLWTHFLAASCETLPPPTPMTASMPIRLFIFGDCWWWSERVRDDGLADKLAADRDGECPKRKGARNASSLHAVTLRDCHTCTART